MKTVLRRLAVTAGAAAFATAFAGGVASAHLAVEAPGAKQGSSSVLSFRISNESETASTTALTVELPGLKTARTEPLPGWTAAVTRDPAKMATSVTWTAAPESGVGPGQFQRFVLYAGPLPTRETVAFKAVQTYSDGKVVTWDQAAAAGAPEPEYPLPVLALSAAPAGGDHSHSTDAAAEHEESEAGSDSAARLLAAGGLALGTLAAAAGLTALVRTRRTAG
ncbi:MULTISPECIES: YcnI family copper-binding membrane protein [Nocardia]|uniref:YcnI family copper-binding membrane protein n=1 Tax=Nocardia TaxID=1817 RepID=UPI000BF109D2|nr:MULTISPECIES: YcnI family protein [Nocardia]PEH79422.1 nuclear export factor GLE1 [Nocardia sp. FDAARGOS_372]